MPIEKTDFQELVLLLQSLIRTPSLSRQEEGTAALLFDFLKTKSLNPQKYLHNVWVQAPDFDPTLPTILLNSHHDTVKAVDSWTRDPQAPDIVDDQLFGLGSNDAGGPLLALLGAFLKLYDEKRDYNLIWAATAEEEISGKNGIAALLPHLPQIDLGIVGEPTQMQMAIAEKGLMVLDGIAKGAAGHAARNEGLNAIYEALADLEWLRRYQFPKSSDLLGPVKMTVSQIEAGYQHNVVPDHCKFVVDVRTNECYRNEEVFEIIQKHVKSEMKARSFRLNSSGISEDHPLVQRGLTLGRQTYGSPTLSDQALMPFTTLKIGPGDSARSHTGDEYIRLSEFEEGIQIYYELLKDLKLSL